MFYYIILSSLIRVILLFKLSKSQILKTLTGIIINVTYIHTYWFEFCNCRWKSSNAFLSGISNKTYFYRLVISN